MINITPNSIKFAACNNTGCTSLFHLLVCGQRGKTCLCPSINVVLNVPNDSVIIDAKISFSRSLKFSCLISYIHVLMNESVSILCLYFNRCLTDENNFLFCVQDKSINCCCRSEQQSWNIVYTVFEECSFHRDNFPMDKTAPLKTLEINLSLPPY